MSKSKRHPSDGPSLGDILAAALSSSNKLDKPSNEKGRLKFSQAVLNDTTDAFDFGDAQLKEDEALERTKDDELFDALSDIFGHATGETRRAFIKKFPNPEYFEMFFDERFVDGDGRVGGHYSLKTPTRTKVTEFLTALNTLPHIYDISLSGASVHFHLNPVYRIEEAGEEIAKVFTKHFSTSNHGQLKATIGERNPKWDNPSFDD